jgi:hypothetical protein
MTSAFGDQASPMMTSANNVGEGWHPLIHRMEEKLNAIDPDFTLQQVKEKFGSLRYYAQTTVSGEAFEEFHAWIADAENESDHICEVCGEPGETHPFSGWLKTLCDKHAAERQRDRKDES